MLLTNHNIILHGAPGTGKTYLAMEIARILCNIGENEKVEGSSQFKMVQFHPSYDYTDFVEGLRPKNNDKGEIVFERKDGTFKAFCKKAERAISIVNHNNTITNNTSSDFEYIYKKLINKIDSGDSEIRAARIQNRKDDIKQFSCTQNDGKIIIKNYGSNGFHVKKEYLEVLYNHFVNNNRYYVGNCTCKEVNDIIKDGTNINSTDRVPYISIVQQLLNIYIESIDINNKFEEAWFSLCDDIKDNSISSLQNKCSGATKVDFDPKNDKTILFLQQQEEKIRSQHSVTYQGIKKVHEKFTAPAKIDSPSDIEEVLTGQTSSIWAVYNEIFNRAVKLSKRDNTEETNNVVTSNNRPNFVFLIDEINRGDMSKIFGELFFAIDPGYRGIKGKIPTQYQNLVTEMYIDENSQTVRDPFYEGFYIPENVYIIGTMNDIDRSVESMDFAMRRRFQFVEVTAESRAEGMGLKDTEAYKRMTKLNECISSKEIGLTSAYHIGGSYFLDNNKKPIEGDGFIKLWNYRLKGLLREYLRGEEESVAQEKLDKLRMAFGIDKDGNLFDVNQLEALSN